MTEEPRRFAECRHCPEFLTDIEDVAWRCALGGVNLNQKAWETEMLAPIPEGCTFLFVGTVVIEDERDG